MLSAVQPPQACDIWRATYGPAAPGVRHMAAPGVRHAAFGTGANIQLQTIAGALALYDNIFLQN
jgi:hypothetical protein